MIQKTLLELGLEHLNRRFDKIDAHIQHERLRAIRELKKLHKDAGTDKLIVTLLDPVDNA